MQISIVYDRPRYRDYALAYVTSYHRGCCIYQTYSPPIPHSYVETGIGMVIVEIEVTSLKTVTRLRRSPCA